MESRQNLCFQDISLRLTTVCVGFPPPGRALPFVHCLSNESTVMRHADRQCQLAVLRSETAEKRKRALWNGTLSMAATAREHNWRGWKMAPLCLERMRLFFHPHNIVLVIYIYIYIHRERSCKRSFLIWSPDCAVLCCSYCCCSCDSQPLLGRLMLQNRGWGWGWGWECVCWCMGFCVKD